MIKKSPFLRASDVYITAGWQEVFSVERYRSLPRWRWRKCWSLQCMQSLRNHTWFWNPVWSFLILGILLLSLRLKEWFVKCYNLVSSVLWRIRKTACINVWNRVVLKSAALFFQLKLILTRISSQERSAFLELHYMIGSKTSRRFCECWPVCNQTKAE